jgi:hypothetical protein
MTQHDIALSSRWGGRVAHSMMVDATIAGFTVLSQIKLFHIYSISTQYFCNHHDEQLSVLAHLYDFLWMDLISFFKI